MGVICVLFWKIITHREKGNRMFSAIRVWVVSVAKWLLKRCTKQWYLVEQKKSATDDWGDYHPTHCASLRDAKNYLAAATDTYFWTKCRILDPDGNVVDESMANDFYCAPLDIVFMYVETNMTCTEAMTVWRKQQLKDMDSRECCDVRQ